MKAKLAIFLFALILFSHIVYSDWFYNSDEITTSISITSEADIIKSSPSGYITSATANLTYFPKETPYQKVTWIQQNPKPQDTGKALIFDWQKPAGSAGLSLKAEVKVRNYLIPISEKIRFPIDSLPIDVLPFTKPSPTIDSNDDEIIKLASEIVKGEDDLFSAVFKIADWTNSNIQYNLSTLTADVSQKASWVLENRQGVCDELTSLFIAMLRSLGIPAKFVSGIAYTNSELFPEKWGPHGWSEVYFPDYGWIPFDVTYGQYGWIDPTHIKFKKTIDSDEPGTYYTWYGRNADILPRDLDVKTSLISSEGTFRIPIKLNLDVLHNAVDFGSYNLVEATISNENNFYYATELFINKPREVKVIGEGSKSLMLLPREAKRISWIVQVGNDLDNRYIYTFPIEISTSSNITSYSSFTSSTRDRFVGLDEVKQRASLLEEEETKEYSANIQLGCLARKEFYEYENISLDCTIKNTGNILLQGVNLCFQNNCQKANLGISQEKHFSFKITPMIGENNLPVIARNDIISKSFFVKYFVKDSPKLGIIDLKYPLNVSYDDSFDISFVLAKKSLSNPKNAVITFRQNNDKKEFKYNELAQDTSINMNIQGKQMKYGENKYGILVNYQDELGKEYSAKESFIINLEANLWERFLLFLSNIF